MKYAFRLKLDDLLSTGHQAFLSVIGQLISYSNGISVCNSKRNRVNPNIAKEYLPANYANNAVAAAWHIDCR